MNWSTMNKEQKQLAVLAGIIGITLVLALYQFVLAPMMEATGDPAGELSTLEDKLMEADRLLAGEKALGTQRADLAAALRHAAENELPGQENPLSWATRALYRAGREIGLEIDSVAEANQAVGLWAKGDHKIAFRPFTIRMSALCGFDKVVELIDLMEERHPFATVSGFGIMADARDPQNHRFELVIEWPIGQNPMWANGLPNAQAAEGGDTEALNEESKS